MPFIITDDEVELFYQDWGTGRPVILIHGWPVNSDMWEAQATFLVENGLRVIAYDRRGFGKSDQPWDGYDYDTLAGDLNALIEGLELEDVTLVGFSMGGGEVARYLGEYGSTRVSKAVFISAVTPYLLKTDDNPEGIDASVFDGIEKQIRKDRADFLHSFGPKFFGRSVLKHTVSEPVLEWTQDMALKGSLRATLACANSWATTDFREDLKAIDIPTLVIHGTGDETVPIDASGRRTAKLIPNATLSEYDGEPHGLFLTAADRLNQELLNFIGGMPTPISDPKLT